jgi:hypothetical protein
MLARSEVEIRLAGRWGRVVEDAKARAIVERRAASGLDERL